MCRIAHSRSGPRPRARMSELSGIHIPAPDLYAVPPPSAAASSITTEAPCSASVIAVTWPAAPAPTTTTSNVSSPAPARPFGRGGTPPAIVRSHQGSL